VSEKFRILHKEESCGSYRIPSVGTNAKYIALNSCHVTRIEETRNVAKFWWGNILVKIDLKERV
jgi:hypothetical protein